MDFKLSDHAKNDHKNRKWNAVTVLNQLPSCVEWVIGSTADCVFYTASDGTCVGLVVSKPQGFIRKHRIVITGFDAPPEYWRAQNT